MDGYDESGHEASVTSDLMRHLGRIAWNAIPGTVSVWCGPVAGAAAFQRAEHEAHYAASMMKVPVLVALHRNGFDPGEPVRVHNAFASAAPPYGQYGLNPRHDEDDEVWRRLGDSAPLGWLAERMIIRSSNLAANLILERVGFDEVADVWRLAGASVSRVGRGIGDTAAAEAGITNEVSAADLAALFAAIVTGRFGSPEAMLGTLLAQERTEDLAAGLPQGARVAHKNGWIHGVRHAAGVVFPADAPPFVIAVCATTPLAINRPDDEACSLIRTVAAAAWNDRHALSEAATHP
jgi:beta-lactamase class A